MSDNLVQVLRLKPTADASRFNGVTFNAHPEGGISNPLPLPEAESAFLSLPLYRLADPVKPPAPAPSPAPAPAIPPATPQ